MNNKYYIGQKAKSITIGRRLPPVTGIILSGDNDAVFIAGNDTGYVIETFVPTATQQMANDILNRTRGFEYQGYEAQNAFLSPDIELGDGITVKGIYGVLANREYSFTPKMAENVSAPYENEDEHEYGYQGNYAQDIKNKVQLGQMYYGTRISKKNGLEIVKTDGNVEKSRVTLNSDTLAFYNDNGQEAFYFDSPSGTFRITQYANIEDALGSSPTITQIELTASNFSVKISDLENRYSSIDQTLNSIELTVAGLENNYSKISQTVDSITLEVAGLSNSYSQISQTVDNISLSVEGLSNSYTNLQLTVDSITFSVSNEDTYSTINLYKDNILISSQNIQMTGMVTFTDLSSPGTTSIYGGNIDTSTLRVTDLYGQYIYLRNNYGDVAGSFQITGASTYNYAVDLTSYGALRFTASYGALYLESNYYNSHIEITDKIAVNSDFYTTSISHLGISSFPWSDVYATNSTIQTSDLAKKCSIQYDLGVYDTLFDLLKPMSFKFIDGESGRRHLGLGAQDVETAMVSSNISDMEFAGFIKSPRMNSDDYDYALRYGEFIPLCIDQIQKLKMRVECLEKGG